jgi:hypothetical protein
MDKGGDFQDNIQSQRFCQVFAGNFTNVNGDQYILGNFLGRELESGRGE